MAATKILCVHGIGHAEADPHWNKPWDDVITGAFKRCNNPDPPQFAVVAYDHLFEEAPLNPTEYAEAIAELLASAAWHAIGGPLSRKSFRAAGSCGVRESLVCGNGGPVGGRC